MGESRQELLSWMNNLLSLNMTKVEQCGTGAALCQIYDSIFLDMPMSRVKFNVNSEYAYLENFKILSNAFRKHHVDHPIPVESLVKCKMQDNLEFLQWSKRYWDQYFPGGDYDALARRKGAAPSGAAPSLPPSSRTGSGAAARRPAPGAGAAAPRATSRQTGGGNVALERKLAENQEEILGLQRERGIFSSIPLFLILSLTTSADFYFSKLRDVELLVSQQFEKEPELEEDEGSVLKQIQTILYSTEEGFEIPDAEGEAAGEEETF